METTITALLQSWLAAGPLDRVCVGLFLSLLASRADSLVCVVRLLSLFYFCVCGLLFFNLCSMVTT